MNVYVIFVHYFWVLILNHLYLLLLEMTMVRFGLVQVRIGHRFGSNFFEPESEPLMTGSDSVSVRAHRIVKQLWFDRAFFRFESNQGSVHDRFKVRFDAE